jgi:hypothetical protein
MTYNADNQLLTWKASTAAAAQGVVHDADGNTTAGLLPNLSRPAAEPQQPCGGGALGQLWL